jgi:hypothetical protein
MLHRHVSNEDVVERYRGNSAVVNEELLCRVPENRPLVQVFVRSVEDKGSRYKTKQT